MSESTEHVQHWLRGLREEPKARFHDALDSRNCVWKDLVRHDFAAVRGKTLLEATSPSDPQFRIDVDDVDAGTDGADEILVARSRPSVQGKEAIRSCLDLGYPRKVEVLAGRSLDHAA
jgi:hypothetical protein